MLLAFRNLVRRPLRNALTIFGLAVAVAVLACLSAFSHGYRRSLGTELDRMGFQMMLVPLGCPYDGAARVLKGKTLENSLPQSALGLARRDPAVAVAAPLLMAAQARSSEGRADLWVGLDESAVALKPWWRMSAGEKWFNASNSVILGCDAAEIEMRVPGDWFYSPETGEKLRVVGVLERSGTSDDNLFFVPLTTAQRMFNQPGRLTAIAIRLHDPALVREASERLQKIPGAQVVTLAEMMGTFLNLVGAVRTLLFSLAIVALARVAPANRPDDHHRSLAGCQRGEHRGNPPGHECRRRSGKPCETIRAACPARTALFHDRSHNPAEHGCRCVGGVDRRAVSFVEGQPASSGGGFEKGVT